MRASAQLIANKGILCLEQLFNLLIVFIAKHSWVQSKKRSRHAWFVLLGSLEF